MKTIGLIGGMSWESTAVYYRLINEAIRDRLGGLHSAQIVMESVDFHHINALQRANDWPSVSRSLGAVAKRLEAAGADGVLICCNTVHTVADAIAAAVEVPLLHIVDATAQQVRQAGVDTVGLLGTRFTMELAFYQERMRDQYGLRVLVPPSEDREILHRAIYKLCGGEGSAAAREDCLRMAKDLQTAGAQGIIAGCTELPMVIQPTDVSVPLFDTTAIHAKAAVDWALA